MAGSVKASVGNFIVSPGWPRLTRFLSDADHRTRNPRRRRQAIPPGPPAPSVGSPVRLRPHRSAIITPPNTAILAVGTTVATAVVKNGQVVAGQTLIKRLNGDHCVFDGTVGTNSRRPKRTVRKAGIAGGLSAIWSGLKSECVPAGSLIRAGGLFFLSRFHGFPISSVFCGRAYSFFAAPWLSLDGTDRGPLPRRDAPCRHSNGPASGRRREVASLHIPPL